MLLRHCLIRCWFIKSGLLIILFYQIWFAYVLVWLELACLIRLHLNSLCLVVFDLLSFGLIENGVWFRQVCFWLQWFHRVKPDQCQVWLISRVSMAGLGHVLVCSRFLNSNVAFVPLFVLSYWRLNFESVCGVAPLISLLMFTSLMELFVFGCIELRPCQCIRI